jgi:hypothetical protein
MADSDDEEETLLLFILLLRRRRRRVKALSRNTWTKRWVIRRQLQGAYANLITELNVEDPEKFRQFHRLERQHFEEIFTIVSLVISKRDTSMRSAISSRERLSITLRFLATGIFFCINDNHMGLKSV